MANWKGLTAVGRLAFRRFRFWRQQWIVREFAKIYYGYPLREDLEKTTTWRDGVTSWLGVPCEKCPLDLWIFQELIFKTKPDVIIETGVNYGGSLLYFASLLDIMGGGEVIGIDVTLARTHSDVLDHPRITVCEGSSTKKEILTTVVERVMGRRTMVVLDSDHSFLHVTDELEHYASLVSPGCYLVVEDTNVNGHPVSPQHGPGPFEAVQAFIANRNDFVIDREQHKYLMSFHPNGWLKRVS